MEKARWFGMEYRGLYIVSDKLDMSFSGCYCEVYLTEKLEHRIDEFCLSPFEIERYPDADTCIRKKINEKYECYASCGYVPKSVSER